jgi:hypothetical protein
MTEPSLALNTEPWQGQVIWLSETEPTVQPEWVQTAVKALKVPALGWVITMPPSALTILPPSTGTSEVEARTLPPEPEPEPALADAEGEEVSPPAAALLFEPPVAEPLDELLHAAAVRPIAAAAPPTPAARNTARRLEPQSGPQQVSVGSAVCCSVVSRAIGDFLHEKAMSGDSVYTLTARLCHGALKNG